MLYLQHMANNSHLKIVLFVRSLIAECNRLLGQLLYSKEHLYYF